MRADCERRRAPDDQTSSSAENTSRVATATSPSSQHHVIEDTLETAMPQAHETGPELRKRLEALFFRWMLRPGLPGPGHRVGASGAGS